MKISHRMWATPNMSPFKISPSKRPLKNISPGSYFQNFTLFNPHNYVQWLLNTGRTFFSSCHYVNSALVMDIQSLYHWDAPPPVLLCRCSLHTCYPILKSVGGMRCCWIFSSAMVWGFTLACTSATSWRCVTIIGKALSKFHVINEVVMTQKELYKLNSNPSAGNNSWSSNIVWPNFKNIRPIIGHDDWYISPAHLELPSLRCCQTINYVRWNL